MWERHAVLARAYFGNDDDVRRSQGDLDGRKADRMRTLAAFAVTLGSDGTVAELLGLHEREVRLARRTVGKEDARAIAKTLLDHHASDAHKPPPEDADGCPPHPEPEERHVSHEAPGTDEPVHVTASSTAVDAVLVGAWTTGTDLAVLASELGLDLPRLVARTRYLEAQGRLTHASQPLDRSGRHRRVDGTEVPTMPQPRQWYYPSQPRPPHPEAAWDQQSSSATFGSAPMHDWDGILDQWQVSSGPTASWQGFA